MATPREQLADALRQARIDAGYTSHRALAKVLNVSRPVISRAENPSDPIPSPGLITRWAKATSADVTMLNDYAKRARSPRSWFARWAEDFESRATLIRWFEPLLIPGFIQTENYARAVLAFKPDSPDAEANLHTRLARQSVLDRASLRVLLLGSVLNRQVGDASVMCEQIDHLLAVGVHPSVTLQIVPDIPEVAGALGGAFAIATQGTADIAVYSESIVKGGVYTESDLITRAVRVWDGLRAEALPWTQTRVLLKEAGEQWKQQM
jgi:transcriptional regulator with XRE-family HTH domain